MRAMTDIFDGLSAAFWLVISFDATLIDISLRSLQVTVTAVVIACVIGIPFGAFLAVQRFRHRRLVISLKWQRVKTLTWDGRRNLLTAALAGFGRAIGEVGAIMIVGGNIDNVTRVLTTAH